jgi:hypothetical protein
MSFDLTDLHTLIVRVHNQHNIPIGKVMRAVLQAAANGSFSLYKYDGSPLELNPVDRKFLFDHAGMAERQNEFRWYWKRSWLTLRAVLVPDAQFRQWLNSALRTGEQKKAGPLGLHDAVAQLMEEGTQPASTVPWDQFCDLIRDRCNGWKDRKNRVPKRNFSDKTIKRIVSSLKDKGDE